MTLVEYLDLYGKQDMDKLEKANALKELKDLIEEQADEAYTDGRADGLDEGQSDGYSEGFDDGYQDGYDEGKKDQAEEDESDAAALQDDEVIA